MLSIQRYVQSINYSLIISRLKDRYFCPTGTSLQGPEKPTCAPCILEELPLLVSCCQFGGIFFFFILVVWLDPSPCFISLVSAAWVSSEVPAMLAGGFLFAKGCWGEEQNPLLAAKVPCSWVWDAQRVNQGRFDMFTLFWGAAWHLSQLCCDKTLCERDSFCSDRMWLFLFFQVPLDNSCLI